VTVLRERERTGRSLADELDEIALACAALPVLDARGLLLVRTSGRPNGAVAVQG
jgi:hypothetical protein